MNESAEILEARTLEVNDLGERAPHILDAAHKNLQDTALVQEKKWGEDDVKKVKQFLIEAAPYSHEKIRPSYWEHILLASIYAKAIAEKVASPEIDPYEAQALALLHDVGRLFTPHRYFRNDLLAQLFAQKANFRSGLFSKVAPLNKILGHSAQSIQTIDDFTLPQKVNHVADNLGKRTADGQLLTVEGIKQLRATATATPLTIWPSETKGLELIKEGQKETWANRLVIDETEWFKTNYTVDFDHLRQQTETQFNNPSNQQWLSEVQKKQ